MNRIMLFAVMAILISMASAAVARDNAALFGSWQLIENAKAKNGKPCPFVCQKIEFSAYWKMISANMPMQFVRK